MLNLTRENVMINIRTMAVSALGSLRSEVLPQWEERAIELRHDAAALRDALVIRFSKDPKVIYGHYSPWEDWAMDAHTTQCAEDNARIHRRLGWLDKAFDNRLKALAKRWGLPALACVPSGFTTPTDQDSLPPEYVNEEDAFTENSAVWKVIDHKAHEQEYIDNLKAQTAAIRRCAKAVVVGLGSFVGLGVCITSLVAMVYLGGWLGSIGALYALGFILEVVV